MMILRQRRVWIVARGALAAGFVSWAVLGVGAWSMAQDASDGGKMTDAGSHASDSLKPSTAWDRRVSLVPTDATAYFTLGEDFADLASASVGDDAKRALGEARRMFVLAARLSSARRSSADSRIASSAMLALASIAETPDEARWLRGVAESVAPPARSVRWEPSPRVLAAGTGAYEIAAALGAYRAGEFRKVRDMLRRQPDAVALMQRAGVDPRQAKAIIGDLEADAARASGCARCKGERIIRGARSPEDGRQVVELCPACLGNPAPTPAMSPERFGAQLRAEALLLGAAPTTWSAQAKIDGAAPLRDIDPAAVAAHYGIDADAAVFRDGAWVKP